MGAFVGCSVRALDAWKAAASPQSEVGSMGQERRHHLAVAFDKAEAQLATLSAKLERSAASRAEAAGWDTGWRSPVEIDGVACAIDASGRLLERNTLGVWGVSWDEVEHDAGAKLRWVDADGVPRFHEVPPWRLPGDGGRAAPLPWDELEVWAGRVGVPVDAMREWFERPVRAPSRFTYARRATLDDMLGASG